MKTTKTNDTTVRNLLKMRLLLNDLSQALKQSDKIAILDVMDLYYKNVDDNRITLMFVALCFHIENQTESDLYIEILFDLIEQKLHEISNSEVSNYDE